MQARGKTCFCDTYERLCKRLTNQKQKNKHFKLKIQKIAPKHKFRPQDDDTRWGQRPPHSDVTTRSAHHQGQSRPQRFCHKRAICKIAQSSCTKPLTTKGFGLTQSKYP